MNCWRVSHIWLTAILFQEPFKLNSPKVDAFKSLNNIVYFRENYLPEILLPQIMEYICRRQVLYSCWTIPAFTRIFNVINLFSEGLGHNSTYINVDSVPIYLDIEQNCSFQFFSASALLRPDGMHERYIFQIRL